MFTSSWFHDLMMTPTCRETVAFFSSLGRLCNIFPLPSIEKLWRNLYPTFALIAWTSPLSQSLCLSVSTLLSTAKKKFTCLPMWTQVGVSHRELHPLHAIGGRFVCTSKHLILLLLVLYSHFFFLLLPLHLVNEVQNNKANAWGHHRGEGSNNTSYGHW